MNKNNAIRKFVYSNNYMQYLRKLVNAHNIFCIKQMGGSADSNYTSMAKTRLVPGGCLKSIQWARRRRRQEERQGAKKSVNLTPFYIIEQPFLIFIAYLCFSSSSKNLNYIFYCKFIYGQMGVFVTQTQSRWLIGFHVDYPIDFNTG